jgi:hypothetical protein
LNFEYPSEKFAVFFLQVSRSFSSKFLVFFFKFHVFFASKVELRRFGKSVLTHMNHVLPHKNSQKPKKKFYFIFSNFSWPKKKCVLAHKFSNILWFYHTFSVVKTHKNSVLPHKKYLFLIINLKFYIQNFFKNVSFNQIK